MAKLYFRYGAMNSGKTTALLQVAHNYEEHGMNIKVIKPLIDKKGESKIVSRLGIDREVDVLLAECDTIKDKLDFSNLSCILVDEVQFLTKKQIRELWVISKLVDIPVICFGLKTNFKGEMFEGAKSLIEVCDEMEELSTICKCGNKARFNARLENNEYVLSGIEVAIDGFDAKYESLCGKCYIEKVLKIKKY